jgi:hypothetical protein
MLKYISLTFIALFTIGLFQPNVAQETKSGEIGILAGGSFYLGDLNKTPFLNSKLALGAFYKHNINKRFSLKGAFNYGHLSGKAAQDNNVFPQINPSTVVDFNHPFYELNGVTEFNFIPFLAANRKFTFTPYAFAGLGLMYYPKGASKFVVNIPFGLGTKYNIYKNFMLGVDFSIKKTFSDKLDYTYAPPSETNVFTQYGYAGNKDWYAVYGIYLSYKIKYRVKCPAFD